MEKLKKFMQVATSEEKKALARKVGTSVGDLVQSAGGYKGYQMKAGKARRIELAVEDLRKSNRKLPAVTRGDLCNDCAQCEHFKKAKKKCSS